jgi:hypothetical protein
VGKRHRRIRARGATGQVAGAATEKPGLKRPSSKNRPAQHAFSQKAPCPGPPTLTGRARTADSKRHFHAPNNRSATRPDPLHPVHRHDVGRTRAPDRTALDDRRYRNEADAIAPIRIPRCWSSRTGAELPTRTRAVAAGFVRSSGERVSGRPTAQRTPREEPPVVRDKPVVKCATRRRSSDRDRRVHRATVAEAAQRRRRPLPSHRLPQRVPMRSARCTRRLSPIDMSRG